MYRHNPSLDVDGNLIHEMVKHFLYSIKTLLDLIPPNKMGKPLRKVFLNPWDLRLKTDKEFRFIMPYDQKRSTVAAYLILKEHKWMATKPPKEKNLRNMEIFLFPGGHMDFDAYAPANPTTRNWYFNYKEIALYVNPYCTGNQIHDFLINSMKQKKEGGVSLILYYLTAIVAHELTHAIDIELKPCELGYGQKEIDHNNRMHSDFEYYYNCDTEVRANQNAAYWVMEELAHKRPDLATRFFGNKNMDTNLAALQQLAPTVGMAVSSRRTKKVFTDEIKLFQKANKKLFPELFPAKKAVKRKPAKKPTKRKPVKRKPVKRKKK
jgi:hypothetical protein